MFFMLEAEDKKEYRKLEHNAEEIIRDMADGNLSTTEPIAQC